jgi:hypothetical protein
MYWRLNSEISEDFPENVGGRGGFDGLANQQFGRDVWLRNWLAKQLPRNFV